MRRLVRRGGGMCEMDGGDGGGVEGGGMVMGRGDRLCLMQ